MEYTRSGVKYSVAKCLIAIVVVAYLFGYLPYQWKQEHRLRGESHDFEKMIEDAEQNGNTELAKEYRRMNSVQIKMEQRNRKKQFYATIPIIFGFIYCVVLIRKISFYFGILKMMDKTGSDVYYMEKERVSYRNIIYKILYIIRGY